MLDRLEGLEAQFQRKERAELFLARETWTSIAVDLHPMSAMYQQRTADYNMMCVAVQDYFKLNTPFRTDQNVGFLNSQVFVRPKYPDWSFEGQTVLTAGANVGLGLEAA